MDAWEKAPSPLDNVRRGDRIEISHYDSPDLVLASGVVSEVITTGDKIVEVFFTEDTAAHGTGVFRPRSGSRERAVTYRAVKPVSPYGGVSVADVNVGMGGLGDALRQSGARMPRDLNDWEKPPPPTRPVVCACGSCDGGVTHGIVERARHEADYHAAAVQDREEQALERERQIMLDVPDTSGWYVRGPLPLSMRGSSDEERLTNWRIARRRFVVTGKERDKLAMERLVTPDVPPLRSDMERAIQLESGAKSSVAVKTHTPEAGLVLRHAGQMAAFMTGAAPCAAVQGNYGLAIVFAFVAAILWFGRWVFS